MNTKKINSIVAIIFVAFTCLFYVQSCKEKDPLLVTGNIEGTVTDYETTQSISGVMVDLVANANTTFAKQSRQTGNDGKFSFKDLEAGNYKLSFARSGYLENNQDVNIIAGQTVSSDVRLTPNSGFKVQGGTLVSYTGTGGNVVIPDNLGITVIGEDVFKNNQTITSVVIPAGVTRIANGAFRECKELVTITLPNTLTHIGEYAFYWCSSLSSVTFPNSVSFIGRNAFYLCSALSSVTIPNSLTTIGQSAFAACNKLTAFDVNEGHSAYAVEDGILFNKAKTILVLYPSGRKGSYTTPAIVKIIGDHAFYLSSVTSVVLSNGVTTIEDYALVGNYLVSVTIPASVTTIGQLAFASSPLSSVTVGWTSPPSVPVNTFSSSVSSAVLHVPAGTSEAYKAVAVWKNFGTIVEY